MQSVRMSAKKWAILPSIISPRPQALKEEIRNENQDKRKIFEPGGIWTHDLLIRTPSLYQLSYEAKAELRYDQNISSRSSSRTLKQGD